MPFPCGTSRNIIDGGSLWWRAPFLLYCWLIDELGKVCWGSHQIKQERVGACGLAWSRVICSGHYYGICTQQDNIFTTFPKDTPGPKRRNVWGPKSHSPLSRLVINLFFLIRSVQVSLHAAQLIPRYTEHPASPINK
jgi:hypothetical protein